MELTGTALVTGAAAGIGRATAVALAGRGMRVLATDRDAPRLGDLPGLIGAEVLVADLGRPDDVERVIAWAGDSVDLLVNNAGFGRYERLADVDLEATVELLTVDLAAPMRLTAALVPSMTRRGYGHVVFVGSIAGYVGVAKEAVYSAAKAGLVAFAESARYELAGTGVGVTVVVPAAVRTSYFARSGHAYDRSFPRPVTAERVAKALVRGVERGTAEVFVPRWLEVPARLRGAAPALFRRLAAGPAQR